jgi:hypothetical protein
MEVSAGVQPNVRIESLRNFYLSGLVSTTSLIDEEIMEHANRKFSEEMKGQ